MKQIFQNLSTGELEIVKAPSPSSRPGNVLIETRVSLISTGTERTLVNFGRSGLLAKAKSQPEKVRQVLQKASTDGLLPTIDAVRSKLSQPIPLGYCNVGVVSHSENSDFKLGDRVVSNGAHADIVSVPKNLCARIPNGVTDEEASFTVVASIGLQGIRLAKPTLGEKFAVIGVGLIGLLTVQMLRANGCQVLAIDHDADKLELAKEFGAQICNISEGTDPVSSGIAFSGGCGVDGVIICASTSSHEPVSQASKMCRTRGRIVLVGVVGLNLNRGDFYDKEIDFQVSCSYGPGRYDPSYEEQGVDYPIGYVRWTEQRNFQAVLDLMSCGKLNVAPLISKTFEFEKAAGAYELLSSDKTALGIVLTYGHSLDDRRIRTVLIDSDSPKGKKQSDQHIPNEKKVKVAFIGAGNYASRMLIPAFKSSGAILNTIASLGGASAVLQGRTAGFTHATSDVEEVLADPSVDAVVIATRHNSHSRIAIQALQANKHVFVEKPLAINCRELEDIRLCAKNSKKNIMVGFNRRFAPQIKVMKKMLSAVDEPKSFVMVMNAGMVPSDHWVHDPSVGGGRIIGEACHYIDLMRYLSGSPIVSVQSRRIGSDQYRTITEDNASITLGFEDGSFGTIHYLSNGGASFPKERIEVFTAGRTLQLDNFRNLRGFNWPGFKKNQLWRQDKGQQACAAEFVHSIENGENSPISINELLEVSKVTIEVAESLRGQLI